MKTEITQKRASELYKMMLFLQSRGYVIGYEASHSKSVEVFTLRDVKGKRIAELESTHNTRYYTEFQ